MIKGMIFSLITAFVFFALAELSIGWLGQKSVEGEYMDMQLFEYTSGMAEVVSEYKFVGERTWELGAAETLGIISERVNTRVKKIDGDEITLWVKTSGAATACVSAMQDGDNGYLAIIVKQNGALLFGNSGDIHVEIGLPDKALDGFEVKLGSGELKAADIKATTQIIDVGSGIMELSHAADYGARELSVHLSSGKFSASDIIADFQTLDIGSGEMRIEHNPKYAASEVIVEMGSGRFYGSEMRAATTTLEIGSGHLEYAQGKGFTGDVLNVDIASGNVTVTNAAAAQYGISLSSGMFDISGLTGTGEINVGSGSGTADFAAVDPNGNSIDLASGSLKVYLPKGASAEIETEVSTGIVSYDCCGTSGKLKDGQRLVLGEGGGRFAVDISSGKVSFLDSKKYTAEPAQLDQVTITGEAIMTD